MVFVIVFVANTYFDIREMFRSLRRVSLETTLCTRRVHLHKCLFGSLGFGILRSLYGLRSSSVILSSPKNCAREFYAYHACLRVVHSEYSDIVVA